MNNSNKILKVKWSKKENDFMIYFPNTADGSFIQGSFCHKKLIFNLTKHVYGNEVPFTEEISIIDELEKRGYDKTTMKFEIRLKDVDSK